MFNKGDKVQVKFATHDGYIWNDATFEGQDHRSITVRNPDGDKLQIPRNQNRVRPVTEAQGNS